MPDTLPPIVLAGPDDKHPLGTDGPAEAAAVNEIVARLVGPEDVAQWDRLTIQRHCLPLDVSAGEDRCQVRHPVAATTLGILRRAVQAEARAWARRQPRKRDRTCPTLLAKKGRCRGEGIR